MYSQKSLHLLFKKVCEMAAVMKEAVRMDEDSSNQQQEMMARLITENKVSKMLKTCNI